MFSGLAAVLSAFAQVGAPSPSGTVVVYVPTIAIHQQVADAIGDDDPSVVLLPKGETWAREAPPRRVIALGNEAARWADGEWPLATVAVALTWSVPPTIPALTVLARPAESCTAQTIRTRYGDTTWVVLAAEQDQGADELAAALEGSVLRGSPRQLHAAIAEFPPTTALWLRAHPQLALPRWLRQLGMMAHRGWRVAGDAPGLASYGIETPLVVDVTATAQRLRAWTHRRRPRRKPQVEQLPCPTP